MVAILKGIKSEANMKLALGVELWLMLIYVPTMTGSEKVNELFTKSGLRRVRMDDWTKAGAIWKARQAHGSSSTFLEADVDDRHLDAAISQASCNIFLGKTTAEFSKVRRLSLAWDPGTYSGHQYNIGLAHTIDFNLASPMPVKASSSN